MPHCAIINCKNSTKIVSRVNGDISFHCFPRNPTVKQLWVEATGNKNWYPTKFSKICSIHFNEEYFTKTDKCRRLSKSAIPTIQVLKTTTREENEELQAMLNREAQAKTKQKKKKHRPLYHLDPDQLLPEVRALIARVHRYLQHEYEQLKVFFGGKVDLSVLANIVQRTAEATGVSERAVAAILDVHQTRAQDQQDTGTDHVEEKPQQETREYHIETVKVEMEEEEEEAEHCVDEEMPVSVELSQTPTTTSVPQTSPPPHAGMSPHFLASSSHTDVSSGHHFLAQSSLAAQHYMPPPSLSDVNTGHHFLASSPLADGNHHRNVHPPLAEVKIEPADDDYPQSSSSTHHVTADSSRVVVRTEPPDEDSTTSQDQNTTTERQRDTRQSRLSRAHKI